MSYYDADVHAARLAVRRVELVSVKDNDGIQYVVALGHADEQFKDAHRVQPFGFTAHPPKGSHGLALAVNGRPDQTTIIGVEHPDHRQKNLAEGEVAFYDANGQFLKFMKGPKTEMQGGSAHWKFSGKVVIEAPTIVLKGTVHLGDEGGPAVHRIGDVDSSGDIAVTGSSKVFAAG